MRKSPVTLQQLADVEFERFDDAALADMSRMFGEDCLKTFQPHFVALRIASRLLGLSKPEMIERMCALEDETGISVLDVFDFSVEFFGEVRSIVEATQTRLMICVAAAARDGDPRGAFAPTKGKDLS
ncbi:hypothetical protein [Methylocystis parvus]|uniref:Uncharacterized protein n=1 Tax=Methylocystis parvus TaxID=134 RepID=A0A6B8LZE7_9HYPH|nr:hypothetical protein [Methylocystis parvus]QGM97807.1 hypothetical protein F7D14_10225 [Methylocystis parvus]WBK01885.1 hypothetical protein MMG94_09355 [Methylocystis parvus OBBP]